MAHSGGFAGPRQCRRAPLQRVCPLDAALPLRQLLAEREGGRAPLHVECWLEGPALPVQRVGGGTRTGVGADPVMSQNLGEGLTLYLISADAGSRQNERHTPQALIR